MDNKYYCYFQMFLLKKFKQNIALLPLQPWSRNMICLKINVFSISWKIFDIYT